MVPLRCHNVYQVLADVNAIDVLKRWERLASKILHTETRAIIADVRANMALKRAMQRLKEEFGGTHPYAIEAVGCHLGYKDPHLHFMRTESVLFAYARPIAVRMIARMNAKVLAK